MRCNSCAGFPLDSKRQKSTPFVFGFTVYESFEGAAVAKSGILQMPSSTENEVGGHAVMAVGYNDSVQRFLVRNSWGSGWGAGGPFTLSSGYLYHLELVDVILH